MHTAIANPDTRPLPAGWSQHRDQNGSWYYVNSTMGPPQITYNHPAGTLSSIKSMYPPPGQTTPAASYSPPYSSSLSSPMSPPSMSPPAMGQYLPPASLSPSNLQYQQQCNQFGALPMSYQPQQRPQLLHAQSYAGTGMTSQPAYQPALQANRTSAGGGGFFGTSKHLAQPQYAATTGMASPYPSPPGTATYTQSYMPPSHTPKPQQKQYDPHTTEAATKKTMKALKTVGKAAWKVTTGVAAITTGIPQQTWTNAATGVMNSDVTKAFVNSFSSEDGSTNNLGVAPADLQAVLQGSQSADYGMGISALQQQRQQQAQQQILRSQQQGQAPAPPAVDYQALISELQRIQVVANARAAGGRQVSRQGLQMGQVGQIGNLQSLQAQQQQQNLQLQATGTVGMQLGGQTQLGMKYQLGMQNQLGMQYQQNMQALHRQQQQQLQQQASAASFGLTSSTLLQQQRPQVQQQNIQQFMHVYHQRATPHASNNPPPLLPQLPPQQQQSRQNLTKSSYQPSYQPQATMPNVTVSPYPSPPLPRQPNQPLSMCSDLITMPQAQRHPDTSPPPSSAQSPQLYTASISSPPLSMPNPHPTPPSSPPQSAQAYSGFALQNTPTSTSSPGAQGSNHPGYLHAQPGIPSPAPFDRPQQGSPPPLYQPQPMQPLEPLARTAQDQPPQPQDCSASPSQPQAPVEARPHQAQAAPKPPIQQSPFEAYPQQLAEADLQAQAQIDAQTQAGRDAMAAFQQQQQVQEQTMQDALAQQAQQQQDLHDISQQASLQEQDTLCLAMEQQDSGLF